MAHHIFRGSGRTAYGVCGWALLLSVAPASARLVALDTFITTPDAFADRYFPGERLDAATPFPRGFINGSFTDRLPTWTQNDDGFRSDPLQYQPEPNRVSFTGSARWSGTVNPTLGLRSATAQLLPYGVQSTLYVSGWLRREGWPIEDGYPLFNDFLVGFTDDAWSKGVFLGYQAGVGGPDGTAALVLKAGNVNLTPDPGGAATADLVLNLSGQDSTFGQTYGFLVRIASDPAGGPDEEITYWVDQSIQQLPDGNWTGWPTAWTDPLTATNTAKYHGSFNADIVDALTDISTVGMFSSSVSGPVRVDHLKVATSYVGWRDERFNAVIDPALGDLDRSGRLDPGDLNVLLDRLGQVASFRQAADLDWSNRVELADRDLWLIDLFGSDGIGDVNLDQRVTALGDFSPALANLGRPGPHGWSNGDLNGDDLVTALGDLAVILADLGSAPAEPASAGGPPIGDAALAQPAPNTAVAEYDPGTGVITIRANQVALVAITSDGDNLLAGTQTGTFGGFAAVDFPNLGEAAWVASANILGGLVPGADTVSVSVNSGTPLSDLTLLYQLAGGQLTEGVITLIPEPATLTVCAVGTLVLRRRPR